MHKKIFTLLVALVISLSFTSCGDDRTHRLEVFYHSYKDDYTNEIRSHLDRLLSDDDDIKHINHNSEGDSSVQLSQITRAIENGCDILAVCATDEKICDDINRMAKEKNIPVVYFERPASNNTNYEKTAFVAGDYEEQGRIQGEIAAKYLLASYEMCDRNADGRISYVLYRENDTSLLGKLRSETAIEETDNILSKEGKPAIEYFDNEYKTPYYVTGSGKNSYEEAKKHLETVIDKYREGEGALPELVLANSDAMALGAAEALKEKEEKIPVFGIGGTVNAENALIYNHFAGTVKTDTKRIADTVEQIVENFLDRDAKFDDINPNRIEDNWKVRIDSEKRERKADI